MIRIRSILLSLVFIACPFLLAEDLPPGVLRVKVDFAQTTGLNDFLTSDKIRDTDAQSVKNVDYIKNGNLTTRGGFQEFSNTGFSANPNYHGNFVGVFVSTTNNKYLIANIEQRLSYFSGVTAGPDVSFPKQIFNFPVDGINWNGYFYVISQDTVGVRFNENAGFGVDFLYSSSVPSGQCVQSHIDRMVVSCSTLAPLTIFYSEADDPDNFSPLNTIDLTGVKQYDTVTGIGPTLLGSLPVYTNNTTRVLTGTEFPSTGGTGAAGNISVRMISDNIGCIHHRTIKNVNNRQYFYSKGSNGTNPGIYRFNGISVSEVTKSARHLFSTLNTSVSPIPNAWVNKDVYCLNVASFNGIVNNFQVCVDDADRVYYHQLANNPGSPPADNALDMVSVVDNSIFAVTGQPYQGDLKRKIYKFSTDSSDYGGRFNWNYKTKDFSMGEQNEVRPKVAIRAYVSSQWNPSSFTVTTNFDYGASTYAWIINSTTNYHDNSIQTVVYSSGNVVNKLIYPQNRHFNFVNFELSGTTFSSVDNLEFYAYPEPLK